VSVSNGEAQDVYTLANCFYANGEFRRVVHIAEKYPAALMGDERFRLLHVQALFECKNWEDCLQFLDKHCGPNSVADARDLAPFCLIRGKIFEVNDNQANALTWYRKAIECDPYCYEALSHLVGTYLLSQEEEIELVNSLPQFGLKDDDLWLQSFLLGREMPEKPPLPVEENASWLALRSTQLFYEGDYEGCYQTSKKILDDDPFYHPVLPVHVASLVVLEHKNMVFYVAHQLLQAYPNSAIAWFTAGCYYAMVNKFDMARRFFQKATTHDPHFAPAWISYGHAFALHDESDQALAAYRTASRLFPGTHLPWLFIGMEYVRTNSLQLAQQCLEYGRSLKVEDPFILNELGVVAFNRKDYVPAIELLEHATQNAPQKRHKYSEIFYQNLGHAYLKNRQLDKALEAFTKAHTFNPKSAASLAGIAFTNHLLGHIHIAIEYYHRTLGLNRDQVFASEMLNNAIKESATFM